VRIALVVTAVFTSRGNAQTPAYLVKDINPTGTSYPNQLLDVGGKVFFLARDGDENMEPWASDGTASGTHLLRDLRPGPAGSLCSDFVGFQGEAYFTASPDWVRRELYRSNGTPEGTLMIREMCPSGCSQYSPMIAFENRLLLIGSDAEHGQELWESDGTESGTQLLADLWAGPEGSNPSDFIVVDERFFFTASIGTERYIWVSDGTSSGTHILKDIRPSIYSADPRLLTDVSGTLFFLANDGAHGEELWRSDGTETGTTFVADINPGPHGSQIAEPQSANGTLFFRSFTFPNIWKSDGTMGGTGLVTSRSGAYLTPANGRVFFSGSNLENGGELWVTDGTEAGTVPVADINPGSAHALPYAFSAIGVTLYFQANDGEHGVELWSSRGSAADTRLVADVNPGPGDSDPIYMTRSGSRILFNAMGELYALDSNTTDVFDSNRLAPATRLVSVSPNPFNPTTTIRYELASPATAWLAVFDGTGRRVRTLLHAERPAGVQQLVWDGRDDRGTPAPSGIYFLTISAGQTRDRMKAVLVR